MNRIEEIENYFPSESWEYLEQLGIYCITLYDAARFITKSLWLNGDIDEAWGKKFESSEGQIIFHRQLHRWEEILAKGVQNQTLNTKSLRMDLLDQINLEQTVVELGDLRDWLEIRDVDIEDYYADLIGRRINLLHRTHEFLRTESQLPLDKDYLGRPEDILAERLEAALSENTRLHKVVAELIEERRGSSAEEKSETSEVNEKSKTSYLNIIGSLCDLYWKAAYPDKSKINQATLIEALGGYSGYAGMSERNLKEKLSKAIKAIRLE